MIPHEADLQRAAAVLNAGKRVAMLIGAGAVNAGEAVVTLADRLQAGCAKALLAELLGFVGVRVERSAHLPAALDTALCVQVSARAYHDRAGQSVY